MAVLLCEASEPALFLRVLLGYLDKKNTLSDSSISVTGFCLKDKYVPMLFTTFIIVKYTQILFIHIDYLCTMELIY
jgi:hypothetical protein